MSDVAGDPKQTDSKQTDPKPADSNQAISSQSNSKQADPKQDDANQAIPSQEDSKQADSKQDDAKQPDPKRADAKQAASNPSAPSSPSSPNQISFGVQTGKLTQLDNLGGQILTFYSTTTALVAIQIGNATYGTSGGGYQQAQVTLPPDGKFIINKIQAVNNFINYFEATINGQSIKAGVLYTPGTTIVVNLKVKFASIYTGSCINNILFSVVS